ncbi:MAG: CCA tRNA nucleotidyltransferase [Candidatus Magasanikbacteria bacterium]|nr:CCA tRNA nucleotidyltransferase [Candidatus Magasanikbacteria bacterium]
MEQSFETVNPFSASERLPEKQDLPQDMEDLTDPAVHRERLFSQDKRILDAVSALATKVKSCPPDPKYPDNDPALLIVGGFARDSLIGKHPKDADVEVYGVPAARLEEFLDQLYGNKVNKVGRAFGIFKVALGDGLDLDISIPRRESKVGAGHKGFEIHGDPAMCIKEAARRRDFTFNALAVDPLTGKYEDYFGGIEDLISKTLRVTDEERFQDDPLRVYRAIQFAARMDLRAEEKSFALMQEMVDRGDLDELSNERITEEWRKLLLKSERPSIGLRLSKELGIIERYYPELNLTDSWDSLAQRVDHVAETIHNDEHVFTENEQLQAMLGAICSMIDRKENEAVQNFLKKTSFSKKDVVNPINALLSERSEPLRIWKALEANELSEKQLANEVRKVIKRIYPASLETLLALSGSGDDRPALLLREQLSQNPGWLDPKKNQLINGADLKSLGIPPGPEMGKTLALVEEARDRGEISTHEEAITWLSVRNG